MIRFARPACVLDPTSDEGLARGRVDMRPARGAPDTPVQPRSASATLKERAATDVPPPDRVGRNAVPCDAEPGILRCSQGRAAALDSTKRPRAISPREAQDDSGNVVAGARSPLYHMR
jgi:hypothetical protein